VRNKFFQIYIIVFFCFYSFYLYAGGKDDTLIFHAGFDNTTEAQKAEGKGSPRIEGNISYINGVHDNAVVVGGKNRIIYPAEDNFNVSEGTCIMWVCPMDWVPSVDKFCFFLTLIKPEKAGAIRLIFYKFLKEAKLKLYIQNAPIKKYSSIESDIGLWQKGEWHLVAFSWDKNKIKMYIDGKKTAEAGNIAVPLEGWQDMIVGTGFLEWGKVVGNEQTAIDELKIYSSVLSDNDIEDQFKKESARIKEKPSALKASIPRDISKFVSLHISFNESSAAVADDEERIPRLYGIEEFGEGVDGNALITGVDSRYHYDIQGDLSATEGALSLWVKPMDWVPVDKEFYFFATLLQPKPEIFTRIYLYKIFSEPTCSFNMNRNNPTQNCNSSTSIITWRKNEWHQLVLSWDNEKAYLYIDGTLTGSVNKITFPTEGFQKLILGTYDVSWPHIGKGKTTIDELIIYSKKPTSEEIKMGYDECVKCYNLKSFSTNESGVDTWAEKGEMNLALADNGAYVLASSFADYNTFYPDNLIDGKIETSWQPKELSFPQWIELNWRHEVKLSRIAFKEVPSKEVSKLTIYAFRNDSWEKVKDAGAKDFLKSTVKSVSFPLVSASRLRIELMEGTSDYPQLLELAAFGPAQVIVGKNEPYWNAGYIYYDEADKVHKGGTYYFRKKFVIDDFNDVKSAFAQLRANDYWKLYINGSPIAEGKTKITPVNIKPALKAGENIVGIRSDLSHNPGRWGWSELLAEISMNYSSHSKFIGTDESWKSHNALVDGWNLLSFNDGAWKESAAFVKPPEGPWGKIDYHDMSVREKINIVSVNITPATAKPGDSINIHAIVTIKRNLEKNYFFIFKAVEKSLSSGDYSVANVLIDPVIPSASWKAGTKITINCSMFLPHYSPDGEMPLILKGIASDTGKECEFEDQNGNIVSRIADLSITRFSTPKVAYKNINASKALKNGQWGFTYDQETVPPLFWRYTTQPSFDRFHNGAETGIHTFHFIMYPSVISPNRDEWENTFREADQRMKNLLRVDPDARIMLKIDIRPTQQWLNAYPEERLINAFGEKGPVSFSSRKYEEDTFAFITTFINYLKSLPYYGQIVAIKPMTCGTPDSAIGGTDKNTWQTDRSKLTVGDYNPQAIEAFRKFLKRKYNDNVVELKKAWKDQKVTFENAKPDIKELVKEGTEGGIFRDPSQGMMPFDYFEFLPAQIGQYYLRLCRMIKKETDNKKLVMIHFGYIIAHMRSVNNPGSMFQNNNFDFPELLNDPSIDCYLGAPDYSHRLAGTAYTIYFPTDSINLHKRMYVADGDYRTYVADPVNYGRHRSQKETDAVLEKDLASCIIGNTGTWFSDMCMGTGGSRSGVGWFNGKSIIGCIKKMYQLYEKAFSIQKKSATGIAIFYSPETPKYHDAYYASTIYNNLISQMAWEELPRIGAPYDIYMMDDLRHPDIRKDFKLYIFINPFFMSDADRQAVNDLKKNGKTLLFLYAPGYVDNKRGLDTTHISEITEMQIGKKSAKEHMKCTITDEDHPILAELKPGHQYIVNGFVERTKQLHPTEFGPVFYINDDTVDKLAEYKDGKTAFAVKKFKTWNSVYTTVPFLDTTTLRNVARFAGVHIYCDDDIIMDADNRLLMLHNGYESEAANRFYTDKTLEIKLPEKKNIYDALTDNLLYSSKSSFKLKLNECETRLFLMK